MLSSHTVTASHATAPRSSAPGPGRSVPERTALSKNRGCHHHETGIGQLVRLADIVRNITYGVSAADCFVKDTCEFGAAVYFVVDEQCINVVDFKVSSLFKGDRLLIVGPNLATIRETQVVNDFLQFRYDVLIVH